MPVAGGASAVPTRQAPASTAGPELPWPAADLLDPLNILPPALAARDNSATQHTQSRAHCGTRPDLDHPLSILHRRCRQLRWLHNRLGMHLPSLLDDLPGAPAPEQPAHPGSGLDISAYAAPPERPRADQLVRSGCPATNPLREPNGRCALTVATYLITTTATVLSGVRVSCAQPATRCRRN